MAPGHEDGPDAASRMAAIVFRLRVAILVALGLITLGAAWLLFAHPVMPDIAWTVMLAGGGVIAATGAYVCLRHVALALIITLSPLAGMACAAALSAHLSFPVLGLTQFVTAYACGFAVAFLVGDEIALRVSGFDAAQACEGAFATTARAALIVCAAAVVFPLGLASVSQNWLVIAPVAATGGLAVFLAWLIVPLAGSFLPYSESFVTRRNRAHEARERILHHVGAVARPRYGVSVAGIALVFSVLGFFGAGENLEMVSDRNFLLWGAIAIGVLILGFAAAWDWRTALSSGLCMVPVGLCGVWAMTKLHVPFDDTLWLVWLQALAAAFAAPVFAALHIERYLRGGDDATIAAARMLNRNGGAFVFAALATAAALLCVALAFKAVFVIGIMILGGGIAALLALPAIAVSIETLVPRRQSFEARYRID